MPRDWRLKPSRLCAVPRVSSDFFTKPRSLSDLLVFGPVRPWMFDGPVQLKFKQCALSVSNGVDRMTQT
jgi:hypothetical protein